MLIAGGFVVSFLSAVHARAEGSSSICQDAAKVAVLPAPIAPWKGAPLRVLFVSDNPLDEGEFSLIAPDGSIAAKSRDRNGGPPYFWFAEVTAPAAGTWRATLALDRVPAECRTITREIAVSAQKPPPLHATAGSIWPLRNTWNRTTEDLFSAWIAKLFDAPLDAELSWRAAHEVLRDRSRNLLFNYLGLGEDEMGLVLRPDCAKLPYLLRAYFAFKMGLPFGYSKCSRGGHGSPPKCYQWFNIQNPEGPPGQSTTPVTAISTLGQIFSRPVGPLANGPAPSLPLSLAASFAHYWPIAAAGVQSGNGRTLASDSNTDFYPVPLTQDTLRPGTIYADPYGHILMLVRRVSGSGGAPGVFLAVDAEPDGTVARKRFWRGNFLFAVPALRVRASSARQKNGTLRQLSNSEIAKDPQYGDFSLEQSRLGVEDFYDRMDDVMSPEPLDPRRAMEDAIASLDEQVKLRVTAVENGRKFQNGAHGEVGMPNGPSIFQTSGAWEDFSTPARDFRLLIAIDVVRGFPDRVARRPERYAMPAGKSMADMKAELQNKLASEFAVRKFSYIRSDGSPWTLTLKDVGDRVAELEMGYNPNDCVEVRWGAPENSEEASTCKGHAPETQRAKMMEYRNWFRDLHWPHAG